MSLKRYFAALWIACSVLITSLPGASGTVQMFFATNLPAAGGGGDITSNLFAWYKFDDGSGTTASDTTGNGHDLALTGTPSWTTGLVGTGALTLSGSGQYGTSNIIPSTSFASTDWTISVWVKPVVATSAVQSIWTASNGTGTRLYLQTTATAGHIKIGLGSWNPDINVGLVKGSWNHIVVTLSGTTGTAYFNGSSAGTQSAITLSYPSVAIVFGIGPAGYVGGAVAAFAGDIDDTRVFVGRALNSTDITTLNAYR